MNAMHVRCKIFIVAILPKCTLYYILYLAKKVHQQHSSRARYLSQMLNTTRFIKLIFCTQTIIVKSIGKVAFLTSFFLPLPVPDPMLSKTYVCAPNCSVISQH